jgi:hypothetical protein
MDVIGYQQRVDYVIDQWRLTPGSRPNLDDVPFMLGCEHLSAGMPLAAAGHPLDRIQCQAWVTLLRGRAEDDSFAALLDNFILDGLLQNNRWQTLLGNTDDALHFTRLVARVANRRGAERNFHATKEDIALAFAVQIELRAKLDTWLATDELPTEIVQRHLAIALFGEAWTVLVYDSRPVGSSLDQVLEQSRPALMPGRINVEVVQEAVTLPGLE